MSVYKFKIFKYILITLSVCLMGFSIIIFAGLYLQTFKTGFWANYEDFILSLIISFISILSVVIIVFIKNSETLIFKLTFLTVLSFFLFFLILYLLKISGVMDSINSVSDFKEYVQSFNNFSIIIFTVLQFLQVVILPIPSIFTIGAGVILFGPFKTAVFSYLGIVLGSFVAYFIGKYLGCRVVKWLIGEKLISKILNLISGKDKLLLTFMLLFPFFPDDALCFVAGLTTISPYYFVFTIIITRLITVFASTYSLNNSIIPYNTWWGVLIWCVLFVLTITLTILIYKNSNKIDKYLNNRKLNKNLSIIK